MKRTSILKSSAAAALPLALIVTLFAAGWLWSLSAVLGLQGLGGWLTVPMRIITFLGDEQFYLIAIPLIYWCIHKELGADLAVLLMMSSFINGALKSFIKHNRPFWEEPRLKLDEASSFSTPSGHSQTSAALFGYLAWRQANKRRGLLWIAVLALLIFLVALSRVYLGVHFPGDVLWGAAIGLLLAALYSRFKPALVQRLRQLSLGQHLVLALAAAALIFGLEALMLGIPFGTGQFYRVLYPEAWRATLDEAATVAGLAFGPTHSSDETSVMEGERRGRTVQGSSFGQPGKSGRDRVGDPESQRKPFDISKRLVWEAYLRVKENKGAPGVDGCSIEDFEADLKNNLYRLWNRMSSGSYFPPPVKAVEIPKSGSSAVSVGGVWGVTGV